MYFITFCGESRTASCSLPALKRKKERDERIGSSREGGKRVERSWGSSISSEIQQRRKLLSELRQRPYHTPLESPPWHPHQDLQIPCPWSPWRPRHPVLSHSLNQLLIQSLLLFFYANFFFRDNSKLCSCGGDRQIFYWDVSTGRVIRKFRGHDGEVCFFFFLILTVFQVYQIIFCWIFIFIKFGNFYQQ